MRTDHTQRRFLETSIVSSYEGLLNASEVAQIMAQLHACFGSATGSFDSRASGESIHALPGMPAAEVAQVYQPQGRIEITGLPAQVVELATRAVSRRLPSFQRYFPSVTKATSWFYAEYSLGQFIAAHVDYPVDVRRAEAPPKYGTVSITLASATEGGDFFFESCGSEALWNGDMIKEDCLDHFPWFKHTRRTRWTTRTQPGDALLWGAEVIHGTSPVVAGRACKLIGTLV